MLKNEAAEIRNLRQMAKLLESQLDAVRHIAVRLGTITDTTELMREALATCLELADAEAGSILLYDPETKKVIFKHAVGESADEPDASDAVELSANVVTLPLKSNEGESLGVMRLLNKRGLPFDKQDVTLIQIMASQVAVAVESARLHDQARLAEVVRYIGDISHDVKNMVTPAITGAETLALVAGDTFKKFDESLSKMASGGADRDALAAAVAELRELAPEMLEMITESCDAVQQRMAEISAAVKGIISEPDFQPTDVSAIAARVEGMLEAHADKKGVALAIEPPDGPPQAAVDGKQIYNAVYNLIFNAIDACEQGDTVTFGVLARNEGKFPDGNFIELVCSDTGPGIPDHVKAKLFTDEAISTKPMGTGLGTRIIKNVVDAHSGRIELESELGVGTTIRCRLPAAREGN